MKLTKKTSSVSRTSNQALAVDLPNTHSKPCFTTRARALSLLLTAALLVPAVILAGLPATATAEQRAPIERVVDGKVTSKSDAALSGAVVYLKDSKSLAMKTYITDEAGHFHFGQLSQNTDYELWAVSNGARSKSRTISSFDDKSGYNFTLKIDTAK